MITQWCRSATFPRLAILLAILTYAMLAFARAQADRPAVDEAWFGSPAMNLARDGSMHTSILESRGTFYAGLDRYTYWILPAYPVVLAGWFSVTGPGLVSMRLMAVLFGCCVIVAVFVIVHRLIPDDGTAALAALLLSVDFTIVRAGAMGRMDSMCAAFGYSALAVYLSLRQRKLGTAFLSANALAAVSLFSHPNGLMYVAAIGLTAVWLDRNRLRASHLAAAMLPYFVLLAAWGAYLANDFALFQQQFGGNASNRFSGAMTPIGALQREISQRYLAGGQLGVRVALLVPYMLGIGLALLIPNVRRLQGVRILIAVSTAFFVHHWLFEAVKLHYYAVHLVPLWTSLYAVVLHWLWQERRHWRVPLALMAIAFVSVHLAGTGYTIRRNSRAIPYAQVVQTVGSLARPGDLIMGSAELAFGLGFDANLVDDVRLGFHSGRRPDLVVLDRRYRNFFADGLAVHEKDAFQHVQRVLAEMSPVFAAEDYEIFVRR